MSRTFGGLVAWIMIGAAASTLARGQEPPPPPSPSSDSPPPIPAGAQVLTRGPIHEGFAEPIVYDPQPGPVVPKPPPPLIDEVPPDQRPEGDGVRWVPGYWSFDDDRQDYNWISGIWRNVPPGRQWVPGYWSQADGGFRWVSGAWLPIDQASALQYLPEPPASQEAGPTSQPPAEDAVWAPGNWVWLDNRYQWNPGYWVEPQPNWSWVPSHYTCTPNGYLYSEGYWDRPFETRGQLFAPLAFSQPAYSQPGFRYQPNVGLLASGLLTSLFVRPNVGQYYFGDYYGANYAGAGIYPWYAYHQSRYGYDPLYSYYAANQRRTNPEWDNQLRQAYLYRRDNENARPPRTYAEMSRGNFGQAPYAGNGNVSNVHNLAYARPFAQIASATGPGNPLRFGRIDEQQARGFVEQGQQLRQFGLDRSRREVPAVANRERPTGPMTEPRRFEMPKSPILAQHPEAGQAGEVARREAMRPPITTAERPRENVSPAPRPNQPTPPREGPQAVRQFAPAHIPPAAPRIPRPEANPQPIPNRPAPRPEPHYEVNHSPQGYPRPMTPQPRPAEREGKPGGRPAAEPEGKPGGRPAAEPRKPK